MKELLDILKKELTTEHIERITETLLEKMTPGEINAKNSDGETALHLAVKSRNIELTKIILKKMNPKGINAFNSKGETALYLAVKSRNIELTKILLEKMDNNIIHETSPGIGGKTVLHLAVILGKEKLIEILLEKMTPEGINAQDDYKRTAVDIANSASNKEVADLIKARLARLATPSDGPHISSLKSERESKNGSSTRGT